jgi:glycosyltransferase involved in cell wall biosynthesis
MEILKLAIINGTPYFEENNFKLLSPTEYTSLKQFDFFEKVVLLKPKLDNNLNVKTSSWEKVNLNWEFNQVCTTSQNYFKRKQSVRKSIEKFCKTNQDYIFYLRLPNNEAVWAYKILKKYKCTFFSELHGDWVESIRDEDSNSILRRITRPIRKIYAKKMMIEISKDSIFCMTIGERLKKFVPKDKPVLITTNHLLNKEDYIQEYKPKKKNSVFKILFVGDIQKRKGIRYLIEALAKIKSEYKNNPFQLDIIGDGPQFKILDSLSTELNLNDSINFHGRITDRNKLLNYFRSSDVFVLPSIGSEGVPRVTHEAMASGCAVIATDVGSVRWQLSDNCGIVVKSGSSDELFKAIAKLMNNIEELNEIAFNGYKKSLLFTYELQKQKYYDFITKQLKM